MAQGWKRLAEIALARSGTAKRLERRSAPATIVLAYHNIVPDRESSCGDISLHIDQGVFARQLDFILEGGREVVPLSEILGADRPPHGRTRVAITFDDAYRGALTAGAEELERRGLPYTVFVPPGLIGGEGFWWDRLAAPGGGPLDPAVRDHALRALAGRSDLILEWARDAGLALSPLADHAKPVDEIELTQASRSRHLSLGAHTWSHPNLAALEASEVSEELTRCRNWLTAKVANYVDYLAYPYGLHSDVVVDCAHSIFEAALLVEGGLAERRGGGISDLHRVPRLNVSRGLSLEGMAFRLTGLLA